MNERTDEPTKTEETRLFVRPPVSFKLHLITQITGVETIKLQTKVLEHGLGLWLRLYASSVTHSAAAACGTI